MSLYTIFLIASFFISCGLLAYKKLINKVIIIYMLLSYCVLIFWHFQELKGDLLYSGNLSFFLILTILILILNKKKNLEYLYTLSWIVSSRCLGFPNVLDFGEKAGRLFIESAFNATFSLWLFFLLFHKKLYQKILLVLFCILQFTLFYIPSDLPEPDIVLSIITPFVFLEICLSFITSPFTFVFIYLGEFILLCITLCQIFLKHSKSPTPKES
ncbi:hypothetical protein CQA62_06725 [Helicobacter cholecystus]|uniref:Integral membrane protein n=1 Tax=Helicobacter cholecystus TaxID=45498 RepID=A0A3D8IR47_9HELI|nr:hypothetical protein CQA62_06725 [Helicobacter cholecystus]VEJ24413.1 Uncharacterised protein [Helicobacter cholecystus]